MDIRAVGAAYGNDFNAKRSDKKSVPAPKGTKTEKVEISAKSSELQKIKSIIDNAPDVRLEAVKILQARIKTNDYPLENNLNEVVKKMMQNSIINPY